MQIRHKKLIDNLIQEVSVEQVYSNLQILLSLLSKFGKWLRVAISRDILTKETQWAIALYHLLGWFRLSSAQCRDMMRYVKWIADQWVTHVTTISDIALPDIKDSKLHHAPIPELFIAQQTRVYKRSLQNDIVKLWR